MKILFTFIFIFSLYVLGVPYAECEENPAVKVEEIKNNNPAVVEQNKNESVSNKAEVRPTTMPVAQGVDVKSAVEPAKELKKEDNEQNKSKTFEYKSYNSFGLNISSHSGVGLSYRYHMDTPLLFQVTGGVVSEGKSYFYAVGLEVQKELSRSKDKRAFGSLTTGIYGERYKETSVEYYTGMNPPEKWTSSNSYSFAIGVGGELALGNSIIDSLTLGCEIYPVGIYLSDEDENNFRMFPGAGIYLFYNF